MGVGWLRIGGGVASGTRIAKRWAARPVGFPSSPAREHDPPIWIKLWPISKAAKLFRRMGHNASKATINPWPPRSRSGCASSVAADLEPILMPAIQQELSQFTSGAGTASKDRSWRRMGPWDRAAISFDRYRALLIIGLRLRHPGDQLPARRQRATSRVKKQRSRQFNWG
jgi:hypothetical protein